MKNFKKLCPFFASSFVIYLSIYEKTSKNRKIHFRLPSDAVFPSKSIFNSIEREPL